MIGKKLSDVTTKRLIVLILILIFSIPILDRNLYEDADSSYEYALSLLSTIPHNTQAYKFVFDDIVNQFSNALIITSHNYSYQITNFSISNYRPTEYVIINP